MENTEHDESAQKLVNIFTKPGKKRTLEEITTLFNSPELLDEYLRNFGEDGMENPK